MIRLTAEGCACDASRGAMASTSTVIELGAPRRYRAESEWVPMSRGNIATKVAIAALAAATFLTACTSHPAGGATPTGPAPTTVVAQSSAMPSTATTTSTEQAAILQAYDGYWAAMVRIFADPDPFKAETKPNWEQLKQFASPSAQSEMFSTAYQLSKSGVVYRGAPSHDARLTDVTTGQAAEIVDCVDSTNWQPVYASTGKPAAAPGQGNRVSTNSTMAFTDGHWYVSSYVPDREKPC